MYGIDIILIFSGSWHLLHYKPIKVLIVECSVHQSETWHRTQWSLTYVWIYDIDPRVEIEELINRLDVCHSRSGRIFKWQAYTLQYTYTCPTATCSATLFPVSDTCAPSTLSILYNNNIFIITYTQTFKLACTTTLLTKTSGCQDTFIKHCISSVAV